LRPKDGSFRHQLRRDINLLQDFHHFHRNLKRALNEPRSTPAAAVAGNPRPVAVRSHATPRGPRGTALYDAVYLARTMSSATEVGRKAHDPLTDGEDVGTG